MRDYLILAIILGSAPVCLVNPYFGVLMWSWIAYFNPHRFGWGIAYNFPVAAVIAAPTIVGALFARQMNRRFFTRETVLLLLFWAWIVFTLFHSSQVSELSDHMADGTQRLIQVSKILLMTCLTFLLVNSKKKLKYLFMITAFSLGLLGMKAALFGIRTEGARVWGPPDSFIADNNDFALALNMTLPMLFFLAQDEKKKSLRMLFMVAFCCSAVSVILTYSRGGLLGLAVVLAAISLKSRHKLLSIVLVLSCLPLVLSLAPAPWLERMQAFYGKGQLDLSAEERLTSWGFAWNLAKAYPVTGGGMECFTPGLFARYSERDPATWLNGGLSSGPHSIYFQILGEQGFVGLGIFLSLLMSCWYSARRLRRRVAGKPPLPWLVTYSNILEVSLLAYIVSGAFLGRAYFDLYFQLVACLIVLKLIYKREWALASAPKETLPSMIQQAEPVLQ